MGDISRHGIEAPPASRLPRPVAKSVTYVAGLKCYQCPWTEPSQESRVWSRLRTPDLTLDSGLPTDSRLSTPDYRLVVSYTTVSRPLIRPTRNSTIATTSSTCTN